MDSKLLVESLTHLYEKLRLQKSTDSQETQVTPHNLYSHNNFSKIPKVILRSILLFLDYYQDIPNVYITSHLFKDVISSRAYQSNLMKIYSHRLQKHKVSTLPPLVPPNESDNIKLQAESEVLTKESALAQLKTANAVKDFLANKIVSQDKTIDKLKKDLEKTNDELRIQKQINSKTMKKVSGFQEKYDLEKKTAKDVLEKIDKITQEHEDEVISFKEVIEKTETEKEELKRHKFALRGEVLRLRNEYQECAHKLKHYNDGVSKMKTYFDAMFCPKISVIVRNIEETKDVLDN